MNYKDWVDYRDLFSDKSGAHKGRICDGCGQRVGEEAYSGYLRGPDGERGPTTDVNCSKRCSVENGTQFRDRGEVRS